MANTPIPAPATVIWQDQTMYLPRRFHTREELEAKHGMPPDLAERIEYFTYQAWG